MVNGVETLRKWLSRIAAATGAVAAGLIVGGAGLAIYSRCFASTRSLRKTWLQNGYFYDSGPGVEISALPGHLATAALAAGIMMTLLLSAITVQAVRNRRTYDGLGTFVVMTVVAGLAILPILAVRYHLPTAYAKIRLDYQLFGQLPTAIAANGLVLLGTVFVIGMALRPNSIRSLPRPILAALTTVGLLVSTVVAVGAIRAGDDQRNVDHVSASRVDIPALPDRLGTERFRIPVPLETPLPDSNPAGDVVSAGAGFVIATWQGLTAYDGTTGAPRWHYLRRNRYDGHRGLTYVPKSLRTLDDGKVVLAMWQRLAWIAFDAMTGEILWQGSDFAHDAALPGADLVFPVNEFDTGSEALIMVDDDRITGYDPRTGLRRWSKNMTTPGCTPTRMYTLATETAVYQTSDCKNNSESWFVATALDARTGAVIATRELGRMAESAERAPHAVIERLDGVVRVSWDLGNTIHKIVVGAPEQLGTAPETDLPDPILVAGDRTGTQVLTDRSTYDGTYYHDHFIVQSLPGGIDKVELAGRQDTFESPALFLSAEIVRPITSWIEQTKVHNSIQSWSLDSGRPTSPEQVTSANHACEDTQLLRAPGATLAVCRDERSIEVVGFAPAPKSTAPQQNQG